MNKESMDDKRPGWLAIACAACAMAFYAVPIVVALLGIYLLSLALGARDWWSVWRPRFWFRLTTHVDCCRCRKRMHRAPLHYRRAQWKGGPRVENISHSYCGKCMEVLRAEMEDFSHDDGGAVSAASNLLEAGSSTRNNSAKSYRGITPLPSELTASCETRHRGDLI